MRACFPHNQFQINSQFPFCVKYRSQGVQTSFYESAPPASDSLGNTIPPGDTEDPGNVRADFPNASEECNLRNISRYSRVLFECIHGMQGIWRWCPVIDLKQLNHHFDAPHFRMHTISSVLSTVKKRRLRVQNRSAGCVLSCTNTST